MLQYKSFFDIISGLTYNTLPGMADASDFTGTPVIVQFSTGQSRAIAEVPINDDIEAERVESFEVRLSVDPNNPGTLSVVEPDVIEVHILDDDGGPVEVNGRYQLIDCETPRYFEGGETFRI